MKRVLLVAGILALGACAESAPEAAPEAEETAEATPADMTEWQGGYTLAYEDGTEAVLNIAPGGTYDVTMNDETVTGMITMGDGGAFCYTPEGGTETECWTNGDAAEDGSWVSTSDQGNSVTVTRVEAPAAEAPAEPAA
ncbi:MAG: hypothetical protein HKN78_03230 [Sphingomonadaceae bacterium]|nr:hypothetical protein [Sphingomonadaceae bacterium]